MTMAISRRGLFVVTILVGSFLLFLIQPLVARLALPRLGGAPNVWNSAMLVYQSLLLAGYAYAHAIGRFSIKTQMALQVALLALAAFTLPIALADIESFGAGREVFWVPALLFASVGPVFFLVSAQAPLIQRWYAANEQAGDPYPLYAASNLGSFAGLLSYPLLLEPNMSLTGQSALWSGGYAILFLLVVLVALARWTNTNPGGSTSPHQGRAESVASDPPGWKIIALWLALSAVPSGLMLSTTTHLTTDIFAMPLLWVIPLGLYLLSFVPAFAERRGAARIISRFAPFTLLLAGGFALMSQPSSALVALAISAMTLFVVATSLHSRLFELRPDASRVTLFYLIMSTGGVVGGVFCALIAPSVFDWVWEHPLLVLAAVLLLPAEHTWQPPAVLLKNKRARLIFLTIAMFGAVILAAQLFLNQTSGERWVVWSLIAVLIAVGLFVAFNRLAFLLVLVLLALGQGGIRQINDYRGEGSERTRSYFGVYKVIDRPDIGTRVLIHGTTQHGWQWLEAEKRLEPTTYYGPRSGVGLVLKNATALFGEDASVGVVGLGAGTLACYREPGQDYRYYEIDPAILKFSDKGLFTFLSECTPHAKTVIGDARLALEAEPAGQFDVLVIDAFSSDAIPLHLLTREALQAYQRSVADGGVILIHISNRFIDLEPVLATAAQEADWTALHRRDEPSEGSGGLPSSWVLLLPNAAKKEVIVELSGNAGWGPLADPKGRLWTDDYASILPHLK